ncbi:hypothetical protein [Metapseudomonas boanensis]|uniref:Uncharacterized protein n=1 Tax=Metapseudomonas boanensis TaxID=2822138 RepID=A0ABS5XQC1_9GAMM|nr:hypothetical protein [Pseudomonas boanensis]MBT8768497.1 hypothetical protein [Pseudomonas boanensis]
MHHNARLCSSVFLLASRAMGAAIPAQAEFITASKTSLDENCLIVSSVLPLW